VTHLALQAKRGYVMTLGALVMLMAYMAYGSYEDTPSKVQAEIKSC
jgi:hypothetical protein